MDYLPRITTLRNGIRDILQYSVSNCDWNHWWRTQRDILHLHVRCLWSWNNGQRYRFLFHQKLQNHYPLLLSHPCHHYSRLILVLRISHPSRTDLQIFSTIVLRCLYSHCQQEQQNRPQHNPGINSADSIKLQIKFGEDWEVHFLVPGSV